jgi:hypothetical protein
MSDKNWIIEESLKQEALKENNNKVNLNNWDSTAKDDMKDKEKETFPKKEEDETETEDPAKADSSETSSESSVASTSRLVISIFIFWHM